MNLENKTRQLEFDFMPEIRKEIERREKERRYNRNKGLFKFISLPFAAGAVGAVVLEHYDVIEKIEYFIGKYI